MTPHEKEAALISAGYHRGTGDLYDCWLKPFPSFQKQVRRLAPYAAAIAVGVAGLLYISV
jgi:hypothetical protein